MSSAGQIIGGVVGAVIGFYVGGPSGAYYGLVLGAGVGGVVDPAKVDGPRLQDRAVQVSSYGAAIPLIYGGDALAGNIIDAIDLVEHDVDADGKGGPSVTTHTYSATFALMIGEGPIAGVRRIWADAKLVYDISEDADAATQAASVVFASYFVFYPGSETQMPDPTLEGIHGVGNVCAYRGTCYLMFNDLPVSDFGNRIPNFRIETSGAATDVPGGGNITYEPLTIRPWSGDPPNDGAYTQYAGGSDLASALVTLQATHGSYYATYVGFYSSVNTVLSAFGDTVVPSAASDINDNGGAQFAYAGYNYEKGTVIVDHMPYGSSDQEWCAPLPCVTSVASDAYMAMSFPNDVAGGGGAPFKALTGVARMFPGGMARPYPYDQPGGFGANCIGCAPGPGGFFPVAIGIRNQFIEIERLPQPPDNIAGCPIGDPCTLGSAQVPGNPQYCINCDGEITPNTSITYEVVTGTFKQLASISYRDGVLYQNGLGPVLLPDDPNYDNNDFWAEAAAPLLLNGQLKSDTFWPITVSQVAKGTAGAITQIVAGEADTTLDVIVTSLCKHASMPDGTYDVSALVNIPVQGFAVASRMPARAALLPLQQAFFWDFVESGHAVKAVLRGAVPAITIGPDDLGASEDSTSPVELIVPTRAQEAELPASVSLAYPVRATGYETGTQIARRVTTASQQQVSVEVAVVMPDEQAAGVADVLMYSAWTARTTRTFATTRKWAHLEPTDVVVLDDGEFTYVVRLTSRSEERGVVNWTASDETPAGKGYSPNVTPGIGQGSVIGGIRLDGPTKLELIDSPIMLDTNDDPGLYAVVSGYRDSWPGGAAYKSTDGGATYSKVKQMNIAASIGYSQSVLGNYAGGNTVDEINSVLVKMHSGSLSTITQDALLKGGNPAILGGEIIQFKRADLVSAGVYRLSGLLRARKGTEQYRGTHVTNERFVFFDPNSVYRIPGSLAELNAPEKWKAVTNGQALDVATPIDFTNTGAGLKPLAPVHLHAIPLADGQRVVQWVRRTRVGGTWRDSIDVPLGETTEAYDVELADGSGAVVSSARVTAPEWSVPGAFGYQFDVGRIDNELRRVGGLLVGIREPASPTAGAIDTFVDATGVVVSAGFIGEQTTQLADDGAAAFVSTLKASLPSHVFRFDPTSPATPTHTYTGTLAADCQGIAFDGTAVWISEAYSGQVRVLAAADLSLLATHPVTGHPQRMSYLSGSLWICCSGSLDVAQVTTSTGAVAQRVTVGEIPFDVIAAGGFVFIQTGVDVRSYDATTGVLVSSNAVGSFSNNRSAYLTAFAGMVVGVDASTSELILFDVASGAFKKRVPIPNLLGVSGTDGTLLFVKTAVPPVMGTGFITKAYSQSDFTGYSVRVYQISSTVGRGFPATIQL